ncbi:MAG: UDP-glucose dehydrogenase family protein [Coriobacteriia bacterium]
MSQAIDVYGAGYVGLVTAACLAKSGHSVRLLDIDRNKLAVLKEGRTPFFEPGLDDILREAIGAGRLEVAHSDEGTRDAPFAYVAVGTPSTPSGSADLGFVHAVIDRLAEAAPSDAIVVMKSTVPPGTGASLAKSLAERGIGYVSNPEFLREGCAVEDWYHADRIVLGGDPRHVEAVAALYADLDAPVVRCDITSAELVKYASNAFLATKISFVNEIASLCDITGADIEAVAAAVGMDHRIGSSFMNAGIGYGGSCFPKDTRALDFLSRFNSFDFHLLKAVIEVNARQRLLPVMALRAHLGTLRDRQIAVLGLTFKPNTDDIREAPAGDIIDLLLAEGATVRGHDPIARVKRDGERFSQSGTIEEAVRGAHGVIVATEWPDYSQADWTALAKTMDPGALVFDGRNCLDPAELHACGVAYRGVGRR